MVNNLPKQAEPDDYDIAVDFYGCWLDALAELRLRRGGGRMMADVAESGGAQRSTEVRAAEA